MSIPARVFLNKAIEIALSKIPNAGRGLFAKEDIKDGELIFAIPRPLIATVNPKKKSEICDNCFAAKAPLTVPEAGSLKMSCCGKCKQVYYCGKACQTDAWKHHHKFECQSFVNLTGVTIDGVEILDLSGIRVLVRWLIVMGTLATFSHVKEEREFRALKTNREMREKDEVFAGIMEVETTVLLEQISDYDRAKFTDDATKDFYCAIASNSLAMLIPVLRGSWRINDPEIPSFVLAGSCLEPFAALLNHACLSNSVWAFDGPQLNVRAKRDITAGEELTISYTNSGHDYHQRNEVLLDNYGFTCNCTLCKQGFLDGPNGTPTGEFRHVVLSMIAAGKPDTESDVKDVTVIIQALKSNGFGLDKWPNRPFHQMALSGFLKLGDYNGALKTALILYYFIEPNQTPPTSRIERLETLSFLIQLVDPLQGDSSTHLLTTLRYHLHFHLRDKYVKEICMCYGADSIVGVFEKESFEKALKAMEGNIDDYEFEKAVRAMDEKIDDYEKEGPEIDAKVVEDVTQMGSLETIIEANEENAGDHEKVSSDATFKAVEEKTDASKFTSLEAAFTAMEVTADLGPQFVSVQEDMDERKQFFDHMNQLLEMTDLPILTKEEMF